MQRITQQQVLTYLASGPYDLATQHPATDSDVLGQRPVLRVPVADAERVVEVGGQEEPVVLEHPQRVVGVGEDVRVEGPPRP